MASFKVIIVGGSMAGLTLANILEQYGIDYVLLEKHKVIAAQIGASIGTLPHGNKILAQLGVFDSIKAIAMPVKYVQGYGPDGKKIGNDTPFGVLMSELCGSSFVFLERWEFLDILYKNLRDKSKVRVDSEVRRIEELEDGVRVALEDGSIIHGDIVVGADGFIVVFERRCGELRIMKRRGSITLPVSVNILYSNQVRVQVPFGISTRPKEYPGDNSVHGFYKGRSYFFVTGADNKLYFFVFQKNPKIIVYNDIPRYTQEDIEALVTECAKDPLIPGVNFTEIYAQAKTAVMVPLQEYVLEKCFYKRSVLIGDSFHKMNPLAGAGGNTALESAAVLADLLKSALDNNHNNPKLDNSTIHEIFSQFQEQRKPRARQLINSSSQMQHLEALDNFFMKFLQLNVVSRLGAENLAPIIAYMYTPGPALKHLPSEYPEGPVFPDEEVKMNPHDRSPIASKYFIVLFMLLAIFAPLASRLLGVDTGIDLGNEDSRELTIYNFIIACTITSFWTVESYRPGHLMTLIFSACPYILASMSFGWQAILPVYFAFYVSVSAAQSFYYPNPRALNPSVAESLAQAFLFGYFPILLNVVGGPFLSSEPIQKSDGWGLSVSHLAFLFVLRCGIWGNERFSKGLTTAQLQFDARDMKSLSRFYRLVFFVTSVSHVVLIGKFLWGYSVMDIWTLGLFLSFQSIKMVSFALSITAWCLFTVWDMRRVNLTQMSLFYTALVAVIGSILVGPAAVLVGLWWWREGCLENGRQRNQESFKNNTTAFQ